MIEIVTWMNNFLQTLNANFGERVWFVGLQGSYGRGEATETSDVDVVCEDEQIIIQTFLNMKNGGTVDLEKMSEVLFHWSKKWVVKS